jgi:hypothetical protein
MTVPIHSTTNTTTTGGLTTEITRIPKVIQNELLFLKHHKSGETDFDTWHVTDTVHGSEDCILVSPVPSSSKAESLG